MSLHLHIFHIRPSVKAHFHYRHQHIPYKTWDYKGDGGFLPTKNKSSVRKIQLDWQTIIKFSEVIKGLPADKPIFVKGRVFNSTINGLLERYCKKLGIPVISIHGLRHTHASLLLFAGVSIASVARRLGHASMTTTQKTYIHIIQEMENRDIDLVMRSMAGLAWDLFCRNGFYWWRVIILSKSSKKFAIWSLSSKPGNWIGKSKTILADRFPCPPCKYLLIILSLFFRKYCAIILLL